MKITLFLKTLFILIIFTIGFTACQNNTTDTEDTKETTDASYGEVLAETASTATCDCASSWFPHSQTPAPAEGKGSPFDVKSTTNCIFHQWSWQKFLWLTAPNGNLPFFLNDQSIIQVNDTMGAVTQQEGANVVLKATAQAGPDDGVLITNPAFNSSINKGFVIHYSMYINAIMQKAADGFRDGINNKKGAVKPDSTSAFPVGSLELKVSWVNIEAIPSDQLGNYFTTMAAVSNDDGATYTNQQMALLGMHVVGVVENHPEFIWATFEHNGMAPDYDWVLNSASSSTETLLFSKGSTSGIDGILFDTITKAPILANKAFDLFQFGIPQNETGYMNTSQSEPVNYDNIQSINTCVASALTDVWKNYFYNGSIWLNTDGLTPLQQALMIDSLGYSISNATPGSLARGSLNCANVSMETFTQTFKTNISAVNVNSLTSCFSCHSGISFQNTKGPIYMSHLFDASVHASQGKSVAEIDELKNAQMFLQLSSQ